jgi:hypothetical protein
MIYKITDLYHFLLRKFPSFFALIYAIIFKFYLKEITAKKKFKKRVIVLNKERFWGDLEELDKSNDIQFVYFDKKRISLLTEPFVKTVRKKMPSTFWRDYKNELFFDKYLREHSKFIYYFLKYLNLFLKYDSLITPSLWYLQDRAFEKGANLLNKKFIFLHKENTTDIVFYKNMLEMYKKNIIKFEKVSSIIVYNDNTKKIISDTKQINNNKIFKLGCPRIDNLVNFNNSRPNKITLNSFTYNIGISFINRNKSHPFIMTDPNLKIYFENIHSNFIDLAANNRKTEFIIKIKPNRIWRKTVENLVYEKEKKLGIKINNLKIISNEFTMTDVLKQSKLVIGINSLSLVEARILGIPCYFPDLKEISNYKDKLYFQKYLGNEISIIKNINELREIVTENIKKDFVRKYTDLNKNFIEEYFGYSDGDNTKRYINFLLKD